MEMQENKNLPSSRDFMVIIILNIIMLAVITKPNKDDITSKKYDSIEVSTVKYEEMFTVKSTYKFTDKDGKTETFARWMNSYGETFECMIPEEVDIENGDKYLTTSEYYYPVEPFEHLRDTTYANEKIEDIVNVNKSFRRLKSIDFVYSDYITKGLNSKEEASKLFEALFVK